MSGGVPSVVVSELSKHYGEHAALKSITLSVSGSEVFGLLGANGAGKTTFLRCLMGLLSPSAGEIRILGRMVRPGINAAVRRCIGYVPDTPILFDKLTALECVSYIGELYGMAPPDAAARAHAVLREVNMTEWERHLIRDFSLGMKRRTSVAAALVHRPEILIMDEVTNGLDPRGIRELKDLMLSYAGRGKTVVLSTHYLEVAEEICTRVAILHRGALVAVGTKAELQERFTLPGQSLESIFLHVTGLMPSSTQPNAG